MKDCEEEIRELTAEEKRKFERHTETYSMGFKYEPPKEKAVKINVKSMKQSNVEEATEKVAALKIGDEENNDSANGDSKSGVETGDKKAETEVKNETKTEEDNLDEVKNILENIKIEH